MQITRSYYKNLVLIVAAILATVSPVFSTFAFSDYGKGMIDYYCTSHRAFFGFEFWRFINCPVYTVIGYITFITILFLLSLFVLALVLDFFRNILLRANIKILEIRDHDREEKYDENARKKITYNYADLKIVNREDEELTECYAEVKNIYSYQPHFGLVNLTAFFFHGPGPQKIGWKGTNNNCYETIGPRTGSKILRVFRLGVDEDSNKIVSDFNICEPEYKSQNYGNTELIAEIEIYVKSKSIGEKQRKVFCLIKWEYDKKDDNTSYGVGLWKINILYYKILWQIQKILLKKELNLTNDQKTPPKERN